MSGLLEKSDMWLVIRLDKDGVHAHMPNEEHLSVLGVFLAQSPEVLELVNEMAKEFKV